MAGGIDPNVLAGLQNIRPVQIADPLEQYTNMLRARTMQTQNAMSQLALDRTNAMNKVLAMPGVVGPDGQMNSAAALSGLAQAGQAGAYPELAKTILDIAHTKAETDQAKAEAVSKQLGNIRDGYASIDPKSPDALDNYLSLHDKSAQLLGLDPSKGDAAARAKWALSQNWNPQAHGLPAGTPSPFQQLRDESTASADQVNQNLRAQLESKTSLATANIGAAATRYSADQHLAGVKLEQQGAMARTQTEQHNENLRMQAGQADQQLDPAYTTAVAARQDMALNNKILGLLNSGAPAGPGKPVWQKIGEILNASPIPIHIQGVSDTDTVAKGQAYVKYLAQNLMTTLPEHMRNLAAPELTAMANANPGQGMAPEAVKSVLGFKKQLDQYQVEQYRQLWKQQPKEVQPMLSRKQMAPLWDTSDTNHFNPEAVANLRAHPETAHHFDDVFGEGSAEQILGGF